MDIVLMTVGDTCTRYLREGIADYCARLARYVPFRMESLPDVRRRNVSAEQQKVAEGRMLLERLNASDLVVLLDERGREYKSTEFAEFLSKKMSSGLKRLVFVVGGPYGFSSALYDRADALISLSRMTFSHEMVRLFFVEQIYRAMTILRGEPYHHE